MEFNNGLLAGLSHEEADRLYPHMPIGENCFFRTADTGIHIWEITECGSYVIKANMDDHIKGI